MSELQRIERIDRLADRMLRRGDETRPATEVWDAAADEIDRRDAEQARAARFLSDAARGMGDLPIGSYDHGNDDAATDAIPWLQETDDGFTITDRE